MIHYNFIIYGVVTLCSFIALIHNYISSYGGGMWSSGKRQYELDFVGYINIFFIIVWTLIWGGVFWW